jgi:O-antigen ligase
MIKQNFTEYLYIFLVSIVGFLHYEGVVDVVGFQWLYLSIVNVFFLFYFIVKNAKNLSITIKSSFIGNYQLILYLLFFISSIVSIFYSLNQSVAIIAVSKIGIILCSLFLFSQIKLDKEKFLLFVSSLFTVFLLIEISSSLYPYFEIIQVTEYKFSMAQTYLKGFAGNKNITSASIAFKIPFVYLLLNKSKSLIFKTLLLVLIAFGFFNLIVLSSRAILVSYSIVLIFLIITLLIVYANKSRFIDIIKQVSVFILPIIIAFIFFKTNNTDQNLNVTSRVSSISTSDVSATTRLRYYTKGLEYFIENPIAGAGIGNFQLISIKLDSDNIESYIVPYVAHNDFIEVFTELGVVGGLAYLLFVLATGIYLVRLFFELNVKGERLQIIFLSMPFLIYFIDANLNFPQYRPIMQIAFLIYSVLVFKFYRKRIS